MAGRASDGDAPPVEKRLQVHLHFCPRRAGWVVAPIPGAEGHSVPKLILEEPSADPPDAENGCRLVFRVEGGEHAVDAPREALKAPAAAEASAQAVSSATAAPDAPAAEAAAAEAAPLAAEATKEAVKESSEEAAGTAGKEARSEEAAQGQRSNEVVLRAKAGTPLKDWTVKEALAANARCAENFLRQVTERRELERREREVKIARLQIKVEAENLMLRRTDEAATEKEKQTADEEKEKLSKSEDEVGALRLELAQAKEAAAKARSEVSALKAQLQTATGCKETAEKNAAAALAETKMLKEQMGGLKHKLVEAHNSHQASVTKLRAEIEQLRETLTPPRVLLKEVLDGFAAQALPSELTHVEARILEDAKVIKGPVFEEQLKHVEAWVAGNVSKRTSSTPTSGPQTGTAAGTSPKQSTPPKKDTTSPKKAPDVLEGASEAVAHALLALQGLREAGEHQLAEQGEQQLAARIVRAQKTLRGHRTRLPLAYAISSAGASCMLWSSWRKRVGEEASATMSELSGLRAKLKEKSQSQADALGKLFETCKRALDAWALLEAYLVNQQQFAQQLAKRAGPYDLRMLFFAPLVALGREDRPLRRDLAHLVKTCALERLRAPREHSTPESKAKGSETTPRKRARIAE